MNLKTTDGHTILISNKDFFKLQHHTWTLNDEGFPVNENSDLMMKIINKDAVGYVSDDKLDNRHENIVVLKQRNNMRFFNAKNIFIDGK